MFSRENGTSANAASHPLAMAVAELIFCDNVQRSLLYNTLTQLEMIIAELRWPEGPPSGAP